MRKKNVWTIVYMYIKSFLQNRTFSSKSKTIFPQVEIKTPGSTKALVFPPSLLSVIYNNDLLLYPKAKVALFADDTLHYTTRNSNSSAVNHHQIQINKIQLWLSQWRIFINPFKIQPSSSPTKSQYSLWWLKFKIPHSTGILWLNI